MPAARGLSAKLCGMADLHADGARRAHAAGKYSRPERDRAGHVADRAPGDQRGSARGWRGANAEPADRRFRHQRRTADTRARRADPIAGRETQRARLNKSRTSDQPINRFLSFPAVPARSCARRGPYEAVFRDLRPRFSLRYVRILLQTSYIARASIPPAIP